MQYITPKQMTQVDRLAMKKYGIKIEEMMERAGKYLVKFVLKLTLKLERVVVIYGKGNNGGGGLVAARYFLNKGIKVSIVPASNKGNKQVKNQLKILKEMGIKPSLKFGKTDVVIDALLGYNIKGSPRKRFAKLIEEANKLKEKGAKIFSLDIPSGINPNSGKKFNPYIRADYTLTLALPKKGLKKLKNVYLVDIGIPNEVYKDLRIKVGDYFKGKNIVKV